MVVFLKSIFLFVLVCSFALSQAEPYSNNYQGPLGKLVDVEGYKLHINCLGSGHPIVVFDAGLGGFSMDWLQVQELLKHKTKVCAYDRAGYGWSEDGRSPRITDQIVDELDGLLTNTGLEPPYILVGHSFGGFNVQYFSKLNSKRIAGLVLVESSHPEQFDRLPEFPTVAKYSRSSQRLRTLFDSSILLNYPEDYRHLVGRFLTSEQYIRTQQREFMNFTQSAVQIGEINRQLDVPLAVITRGQRV